MIAYYYGAFVFPTLLCALTLFYIKRQNAAMLKAQANLIAQLVSDNKAKVKELDKLREVTDAISARPCMLGRYTH